MISILYRLFQSRAVRVSLKYLVLALFVWFVIHLVYLNYTIINSNGIHGIVSRKTWEQIQSDTLEARAYDSIPTNYSLTQ